MYLYHPNLLDKSIIYSKTSLMELDVLEAGYYYHFFNRGNNRENIFLEEKNYYFFLELMKKHLLPVCDIYSYCLLPNHFHLLIRIKDSDEISERYRAKIYQPFSNLFNAYTKSMNHTYGRRGSLFQKHPHRIRILNDNYLMQLIAYIHLNPYKHGIKRDFETYPFSSYQAILSNKKTSVKRKEVIETFDDLNNFIYWHDINKLKIMYALEEIEKQDE